MTKEEVIKDCCFQFGSSRGQIYEDSGLITLERAKEMWKENYPKAAKLISEGVCLQMYIWINMKDDSDFHSTLITVENDFESDGKNIYPNPKTPVPINL